MNIFKRKKKDATTAEINKEINELFSTDNVEEKDLSVTKVIGKLEDENNISIDEEPSFQWFPEYTSEFIEPADYKGNHTSIHGVQFIIEATYGSDPMYNLYIIVNNDKVLYDKSSHLKLLFNRYKIHLKPLSTNSLKNLKKVSNFINNG